MSVTFTQLSQTIELSEKVKIGTGEKIVSTNKVGRKKDIEVTISTRGGKFFVYFDGEKYAGEYRSEKDANNIVKDYLKLVGEELEENRAKRDAMRAMGRKSGKDAADIDTDATDKDREQADKNVIVQLRKVISLRGMKPVEFSNGKKVKLNPKDAEKILRIYQNLKPASKLQLQTFVSKSPENFKKAVSELKEELDEAPKMKYALVGTDMKIYSMGSDERDLKLDRRSLEKRFKDVAPLKMARLKTAQAIGDKVDKSQLKEEIENFSEALEEGKMKQLHDLITQGKSAQQIAKMLKLDVKTIQALMDETDLEEFFGRKSKKVVQSNISKVLDNIATNSSPSPKEVKFKGGKVAKVTPGVAAKVVDYLNKKSAEGSPIVKNADNWDEFKKIIKALKLPEPHLIREAGLPPHLAKLFDKDGNFKDPKKQKVFDRMMGDGIGKEIAQKMGRIQYRVQADSAKKKLKVYVDSNDEHDAQKALKNHPAYISGALRVIPEEVYYLVSEKVTPYVYNSFNEFVVHHGDKEETDTSTIKERALTKFELKKREKIAKDLPDAEFKKRYGDDWMNVKMGTATNIAKGES